MTYNSFTHIFQEGRIGNLIARNRLVMPPMGTNLAQDYGEVTDRLLRYYEERAEGGVGTIIVEVAAIHPGGRAIPRQIGIWDDRYIPGLARLASAIKRHGALAFIQLHHAGRQTATGITGSQPVAPSALPCPVMQEMPRPLELHEIRGLVSAFGEGARRARQAGFDAVEIHGTHGYLINQFLSPYSNHRHDDYGGSLENRLRFALEILAAARERTAGDYPITFRINGNEYMEGGITLDEAKIMARHLVKAKVGALHVSAGVYGSPAPMIPLMGTPPAPLLDLAAGIKSEVQVPVIAVAKIHEPLLAEKILAENKADFISMGRALIADPHMPKKLAEARLEEIRACITCNQGCVDPLLVEHKNVSCIYNARAGREVEFPMIPAKKPKVVLVIGGGPAGMEAARVAAERGHDVHLYEETHKLGGQALLASATPHKHEFGEIVRYLAHEVARLGVDVRMGQKAGPDTVRQLRPQVVIVATGALPSVPDLPGVDGEHVIQAWEVIRKGDIPAKRVAIIGGGLAGCETAELLADQEHTVTVIEMMKDIAMDIGPSLRSALLERLMNDPRVKVITGAEVRNISNTSVTILKEGTRQEVKELDAVVLATGSRPRREPAQEIEALGVPTYVIGDANEPRKALEAIHEAFETAYGIQ